GRLSDADRCGRRHLHRADLPAPLRQAPVGTGAAGRGALPQGVSGAAARPLRAGPQEECRLRPASRQRNAQNPDRRFIPVLQPRSHLAGHRNGASGRLDARQFRDRTGDDARRGPASVWLRFRQSAARAAAALRRPYEARGAVRRAVGLFGIARRGAGRVAGVRGGGTALVSHEGCRVKLAVSNIAWPQEEDAAVAELLNTLGIAGIEIAPTKIWADPLTASDA